MMEAQVALFGRYQRETLGEIKAHLVTEDTERSRPSAIFAALPFSKYRIQKR